MSLELKILGTGSASPVFNRHPSAQILNVDNNYFFLIDCGEGTQFQMLRYRFSHAKISHIFISHLHGDHYLGLVGLISSMHLWGRKKELFIYGPKGLAEIITIQFRYSETVINYPIHFIEINTEDSTVILDLPTLTVTTIPLSHRIACCGFRFSEKPKKRRVQGNLLPETITPLQKIALKKGEDIYDSQGNLLANKDYTLPPRKSLSYSYCSDTCYLPEIIPLIAGSDLLFHEATFDNAFSVRARDTYHSTAEQAARIALEAGVGQLLIGHFSSRYRELDTLYDEAKAIFPNALLAEEGKSYLLED